RLQLLKALRERRPERLRPIAGLRRELRRPLVGADLALHRPLLHEPQAEVGRPPVATHENHHRPSYPGKNKKAPHFPQGEFRLASCVIRMVNKESAMDNPVKQSGTLDDLNQFGIAFEGLIPTMD